MDVIVGDGLVFDLIVCWVGWLMYVAWLGGIELVKMWLRGSAIAEIGAHFRSSPIYESGFLLIISFCNLSSLQIPLVIINDSGSRRRKRRCATQDPRPPGLAWKHIINGRLTVSAYFFRHRS